MATRVRLGSIYLNNSTGFGVAGGSATGESTTPWAVRNDWTPMGTVPVSVWGGDPLFTPGRVLAYQGYDDVTQSIPLLLDVTGGNDLANELRVLRQEFGKIITQGPLILEVLPNNSSNVMYAQVKTAWLQEETDRLIMPVANPTRLHVRLTIVRSPWFGGITAESTDINATSVSNTGSAGANVKDFGATLSGDLIYMGQPLNIKILPANTAGNSVGRLWAATVATNPTYSTTGSGAHNTTSTTGSNFSLANFDTTVCQANIGVKPRVLARLSTTSNCEAWITAGFNVSGQAALYTSQRVTFSGGTTVVDFGSFSPVMLRRAQGLTSPIFDGMLMWWRSTDGLTATVTLSSVEYLQYYDICRIDPNPALPADGSRFFLIDGFQEANNFPCLPYSRAQCLMFNGSQPAGQALMVGRAPLYYAGSLLWMEWLDGGGSPLLQHTTTRTATVTAKHAPLWVTTRGAQ